MSPYPELTTALTAVPASCLVFLIRQLAGDGISKIADPQCAAKRSMHSGLSNVNLAARKQCTADRRKTKTGATRFFLPTTACSKYCIRPCRTSRKNGQAGRVCEPRPAGGLLRREDAGLRGSSRKPSARSRANGLAAPSAPLTARRCNQEAVDRPPPAISILPCFAPFRRSHIT